MKQRHPSNPAAIDKRQRDVHMRVNDAEYDEIQRACEQLDMSASELCRRGAMAYYRRVVGIHRANRARRQPSTPADKT